MEKGLLFSIFPWGVNAFSDCSNFERFVLSCWDCWDYIIMITIQTSYSTPSPTTDIPSCLFMLGSQMTLAWPCTCLLNSNMMENKGSQSIEQWGEEGKQESDRSFSLRGAMREREREGKRERERHWERRGKEGELRKERDCTWTITLQ